MLFRVALVCCFLAAFAGTPCRADPVDLELVLSVDSTGSIDNLEFRLQREGYARALTHPEVISAIGRGPHRSVAITFIEWSGPDIRNRIVGWTRISGAADAAAIADVLLKAPRTIFGGGTSIAGAILNGVAEIEGNGFEGTRRVIDISGDGPNNRGPSVTGARDLAVGRGITINGLPILEDDDGLEGYYRAFVIGGPGAFVQPAQGFADFERAVLRKLLQELNLSGAGGSGAPDERAFSVSPGETLAARR